MRQIVIPKYGPPGVLALREAPDPTPGPDEVLIDVRAFGINFADILARMGMYPDAPKPPAVVGYEVAGVITAVGQGETPVAGFRTGDRVGALTTFGGYADRVVTRASRCFRLPEGVTFSTAAALPVNYLTAWLMLNSCARLQKGETVLIQGIAGGVGRAATELARLAGAHILGTASASKHETVRQWGAELLVDYRTQDFQTEVMRYTSGRGVDVVLDPIGGRNLRKSYACLAPLGRLIVFGFSSIATGARRSWLRATIEVALAPRFHPLRLMSDNRAVIGFNLGHLWGQGEKLAAAMRELVGLLASGAISPIVQEVPFPDVAAAHRLLQERRNIGKVVVTL